VRTCFDPNRLPIGNGHTRFSLYGDAGASALVLQLARRDAAQPPLIPSMPPGLRAPPTGR
jgi:hypothetical protein